jgi:hypothetical protein
MSVILAARTEKGADGRIVGKANTAKKRQRRFSPRGPHGRVGAVHEQPLHTAQRIAADRLVQGGPGTSPAHPSVTHRHTQITCETHRKKNGLAYAFNSHQSHHSVKKRKHISM